MPFCDECQREWDASRADACPYCAAAPSGEDLGATIDSSASGAAPSPRQADVTVAGNDDATPAWDDLPQSGDASPDDATIASEPLISGNQPSGGDPNAATIDSASATFGDTANPGQRRPSLRDLTEVSADPPTPTALRGRSSSALGPGDSVSVDSENVRLRSHALGKPTAAEPSQPPRAPGVLDYQHAEGPWEGGMGQVWKSRQATLDRHVAIKQIRTDNPSQRDRDKFVSEAVITGSLEHPNIIPVHDLGVDSSGMPFYSMKFVGGLDWDDAREQRDMSEAENLAVLIQVSQAIAFAHSRNVIHMDLKPNNIRLGDFGEVLVMDWGLAARVSGDSEIEAGGTPGYMAPELAAPYYRKYLNYTPEGRKAKDSDALDRTLAEASTDPPAGTFSDIYLLGALLYWIVTGSAPHQGKTRFKLLRAAARNEIAPTKKRTELLDIAYKAMATDPANRYTTAIEFIDAVKSYQAHAQSVEIARLASRELKSAERARSDGNADAKDLYESYARARHGYENALTLWPENGKAKRRLAQTRRVYAEAAYGNGDYDLALSLIENATEEDERLRRDVVQAQRSRDTRVAWYRTLQYLAGALLVAALIFIAISAYFRQLAFDSIALANEAETRAKEAETRTDAAIVRATNETARAEAAQRSAEEAVLAKGAAEEEAARFARQATESAAAAEESERVAKQATLARVQAERSANEQRYFAAVASVRSALSDDGQYAADRVLESYRDQLPTERLETREWKRLERLTDWEAEAQELLPANKRLAVASANGQRLLVARATPNGAEILLYASGDDEAPLSRIRLESLPTALALSADARFAAAATPDLVVWDLRLGQRVQVSSSAKPVCLAFHPAKNELLVGGQSTRLEQWQFDNEGKATRLSSDERWHRVSPVAIGYSSDGGFRWSADSEGVVRVWRQGVEQLPWSYRHDRAAAGSAVITCAAMAAADKGGRFAYGCADGSVYELVGPWSKGGEGKPNAGWIGSAPQRLRGDHERGVIGLKYANDARALVSISPSEALVRPAPLAESPIEDLKRRRRYHDRPITALAVLPTGEAITSDAEGRVVRWRVEVAQSKEGLVARPNGSPVTAIWFDARSRSVAAADANGFIRLHDGSDRSKKPTLVFRGHADHANWRTWRVDQPRAMIVTAAADGVAIAWDAASGALIERTPLGGRDIVTVTKNGLLVAAASGKPAFAQQLPGGPRRSLWGGEPRVSAIEPLDAEGDRFAVGLRDGQIYLWSSATGREELVASNVRPHWRPILSMCFAEETGALLVGDSGGLITRWAIGLTDSRLDRQWSLDKPHPVVQIQQSPSGDAFAVQRWAGRRRLLRLSDSVFKAVDEPIVAGGFAGDRLFGLDDNGLLRIADESRWTVAQHAEQIRETAPVRPTGLLLDEGELVTFGPGFFQRWTSFEESPTVVASAQSRPAVVACGAAREGSIAMIDASGWNGRASLGDGLPSSTAQIGGTITAWTTGQNPGQPTLALFDGESTNIVRWDMPNGQPVRVLRAGVPGRVPLVATAGEAFCFVEQQAARQMLVLTPAGDAAEIRIELPGGEEAAAIAIAANRQRAAIVYRSGRGALAELQDGVWSLGQLTRTDLSAASFTPDGTRLLLGTNSGRVLAVEPRIEGASVRTRRLMTFSGHSNPVRVLRYARDGATLLSGDASGGVATHTF